MKLADANWDAPPPFEGFRSQVAGLVGSMIVSHQADRGVSGALHEETAYGWDAKSGKFTVRKPVLALTAGEIEGIRDEGLKKRVRKYRAAVEEAKQVHKAAREAGEAPGKFVEPELRFQDRHGKWRVVRRVKNNTAKSDPSKMLFVPNRPSEALGLGENPRAAKAFPFGSNHHFVIYDDKLSDRRTVEIVTMHEAAQRAVRGKPIFQMEVKNERYVPVMALCKGDVVEFHNRPHLYYTVAEFSSPGVDAKGHRKIDARFLPHSVAQKPRESPHCLHFQSTDHLHGIVQKVQIERLGRVWPASDRL